MSEQKRSERTKDVPHHPLVKALASDPSQPPKRAARLFGYPGPAADPKTTRLWLDLNLTSYVDIPDEAILHSRALPDEEGTILWVDPTATLTRSTPQAQEVQAEFLGGAITQRNLAGAVPGPGERASLETSLGCPATQWWDCQITRTAVCRTTTPPCHQVEVPIGGLGGGNVGPPTAGGFVCQSWNRLCPTDRAFCERFGSMACVSFRTPCPVVAESGTGVCPTEPWTGTTPEINPVGPFRPQQ